ncbi:MAG: adenosylcobalamin-dependent ribonucleoside-diphosphate reductase [Candidatus Nanohaloarchaeota archaeon]|nr:adenosylcobalamin-dependent ribonucleoside-diphosphate reductase [Candidatus Nanohaloarchaeota archaeon]
MSELQAKENFEQKINKMFSYKSKLRRLISEERIEAYKKTYLKMLELLKKGLLPSHPDYLGGSELAESIYKKKYYLKDVNGELIETKPELLFIRVASYLASTEKDENKRLEYAKSYYMLMYEGKFLPGGRVLAGAGDLFRLKTLANCFVSAIHDDSIEAIYQAAYEAARTYSYGGGIGIDLSVLRPKDTVVHNAADKSTGAVSFAELYSMTTGLIGQSGRRGALMITLHIKHPDIIEFIKIKKKPNWTTEQIINELKMKGINDKKLLKEIEKAVVDNTQVRFANISIKVTDEFMKAVEEQNEYGPAKILVYRKNYKGVVSKVENFIDQNYSVDMPSKDLSKYELEGTFDDIDKLNGYLKEAYNVQVEDGELNDINKRDVYGDYVLELKDKDYDLAIKYAGDFLLYFASPQVGEIKRLVKAREIWDLFVESNYKAAEPGLMFWSSMTRYSPSNYVGIPIITTNPCGEVPLEDGGSCNLGSVNLSRFVKNPYTPDAEIDEEELKRVVRLGIRLMDSVTSWNEILNPLEKQRRASKLTRRIGLGIMGMADMLNQMNLAYDSSKALALIDRVMRIIANTAYDASADLAEEKGKAPVFDYEAYSRGPFFKEVLSTEVKEKIRKKGLRNIALLSIAPTGTLSNIVLGFVYNNKHYIGVSGGIEPVFALYYTRRSETVERNKFFKVFHPPVQAYIDMHGLNDKIQDAKNEEELKKILPSHFFRTAHHIDPFRRVEIQAVCQKYVDHSISSTINLPEDIEPEVISNLYIHAWKMGLKGVTIYRDGSRFPVLSVEGKQTEFQKFKDKEYVVKDKDGNELVLKGDDVIVLPDGTLTTLYHAIKKGLISLDQIAEV